MPEQDEALSLVVTSKRRKHQHHIEHADSGNDDDVIAASNSSALSQMPQSLNQFLMAAAAAAAVSGSNGLSSSHPLKQPSQQLMPGSAAITNPGLVSDFNPFFAAAAVAAAATKHGEQHQGLVAVKNLSSMQVSPPSAASVVNQRHRNDSGVLVASSGNGSGSGSDGLGCDDHQLPNGSSLVKSPDMVGAATTAAADPDAGISNNESEEFDAMNQYLPGKNES